MHMFNVAEKHALEMACPAVMIDFAREDGARLLLNGIDPRTTPGTEIINDFSVDAASESGKRHYPFRTDVASGDKTVEISFTNDFNEKGVGDRNLNLINFSVTDRFGDTVFSLDLKDIDSVTGATYNCGGPSGSGFRLWCNGTVSIPLSLELDGAYDFAITAYGDQYGLEATEMVVSLNSLSPKSGSSKGALAIKAVVVSLHNRLLGQSLDITDPEINMTYQLLVDSWEARKIRMAEKNNTAAVQFPEELCHYPLAEHTEKGGLGHYTRGNDPSGMKSSWASVLAYLMTDSNYLHE